MKIIQTIIALASLSYPAHATLSSSGVTGTGTASDFADISDSYNSTGSVKITGLNITSLLSNTITAAKWQLQANVSEVTNVQVSAIPNDQAITYSRLAISYADAASVPKNGSTNWNACALVINDLYRNATVDGQDDDGTCEATVGQECINAFNLALMDANPAGAGCGVIPSIPMACNGSMSTKTSMELFELDLQNLTSATENRVYTYSSQHDSSNLTTYEDAVTAVTPVILYFQAKNSSRSGITGQANMACVRAGNATTESTSVTHVPGTGNAGAISLSYFTLISGLMVIILML